MTNFLNNLNAKVSKMTPFEIFYYGMVGGIVLIIIDNTIAIVRDFF